jgi:hypothetical protein
VLDELDVVLVELLLLVVDVELLELVVEVLDELELVVEVELELLVVEVLDEELVVLVLLDELVVDVELDELVVLVDDELEVVLVLELDEVVLVELELLVVLVELLDDVVDVELELEVVLVEELELVVDVVVNSVVSSRPIETMFACPCIESVPPVVDHLPTTVYVPAVSVDMVLDTTKTAPSSFAFPNVLVTALWSVPSILIQKSALPPLVLVASMDIIAKT